MDKFSGLKNCCDLVVVGAGPAGSAAAITAARAGLSVLQVDAKRFPRHKVCGGCLNPATLGLLEQLLGVEKTAEIEGVLLGSFHLHTRQKEFSFHGAMGMAVDRSQLDQTLVTTGQDAGVEFRDSLRARIGKATGAGRTVELIGDGVSDSVLASAVVVATGLGSSGTHSTLSLARISSKESRVGVETIIDDRAGVFPSGRLVMAVGRNGYVGMTKLTGERLHLAASVDRKPLKQIGPEAIVRKILNQAGVGTIPNLTGDWRGTSPLTSRASALSDERMFVVGDAAQYVEPFTGEGIRWALETGMGVVPLVLKSVDGWVDSYGRDWNDWYQQNIVPEQRLCRRMAFGLKQPFVRWFAHQAISIRPKLVRSFISRINQ